MLGAGGLGNVNVAWVMDLKICKTNNKERPFLLSKFFLGGVASQVKEDFD